MGLFTGLITLPLAPLRGVVWLGDTLAREAYKQWTDPAVVRAELETVDQRWRAGEISDDQRDDLEDALLQRLIAGRSEAAHG
jgi:hypothetical protein